MCFPDLGEERHVLICIFYTHSINFFFFSYFLCDFTTAAKNQGMAVKLMSFFLHYMLFVIEFVCLYHRRSLVSISKALKVSRDVRHQ